MLKKDFILTSCGHAAHNGVGGGINVWSFSPEGKELKNYRWGTNRGPNDEGLPFTEKQHEANVKTIVDFMKSSQKRWDKIKQNKDDEEDKKPKNKCKLYNCPCIWPWEEQKCETEEIHKLSGSCWEKLAEFNCSDNPDKKKKSEALEKGLEKAKKENKPVLYFGNTGG